jgi:hypothetical protein
VKRIPLINQDDLFALVDDEDYERVRRYKWYLLWGIYTKYAFSHQLYREGKSGLMHRFLTGVADGMLVVDHLNYNGLDNTRANMKVVTRAENNSVERRRKHV